MFPELTREELAAGLDCVAAEILAEAGVAGPPVDALAVAHEIGEHIAYRVFARWGADPVETAANAREQVANWLAGRLLLPTAWFAADGTACGWDLLALKARYNTASHELIARRMLECRPPVMGLPVTTASTRSGGITAACRSA